MSDFGHWTTTKEEFPEDAIGFVYRITNTVSGRMYIGKKLAKTIKKLKPLKGKKRCRKVAADTDWKKYSGSSNDLNADILALGKDKFNFEILVFCKSKAALAYVEAFLQIKEDVISNYDLYYNGIINVRIGRSVKLMDELEEIKKEYSDIM